MIELTKRQAIADKILVLGIDGMDPSLTRKYVDKGVLPNVKKLIERGSCRHDLAMLGGHPTVTPPMWTTLATGCYANVHGITGFYLKGDTLDTVKYAMGSYSCHAEQVWNVFAEAGKKTLVWHWPGSAWPALIDSPNLMIVDGTAPGSVAMAVASIDTEYMVVASEDVEHVVFKKYAVSDADAPCVINDLDLEREAQENEDYAAECNSEGWSGSVVYLHETQKTHNFTEIPIDVAYSPLKPAQGWDMSINESDKEFVLQLTGGLIRRPCLLRKGETGVYDRVEIYKNKKDNTPMVIMKNGDMVRQVIDECFKDGEKKLANRNYKTLRIAEDGSSVRLYISAGMDINNDKAWHPKRLFKSVAENVGYPTPTSMVGNQDDTLITDCMLANWDVTADWQAASIQYLIESEDLDVVFSHLHSIDLQMHMFCKYLADKPWNRHPVSMAEKWVENIYIQVDNYLGKFMHYLDEGWTIMLVSDHALVSPKYDKPYLGEAQGVNVPLMRELGFTEVKKDENGNDLPEIDWEKTRAIAQREHHIYINLKGRDEHGIVDPSDKYELEEEIITKLYQVTSPETGHRVVAIALRNKDAIMLGLGGPDSGDICYWLADGYEYDHSCCMATATGEGDTSVAPIFIGAGPGFKAGFETERILRQIDFAPTVAYLGGVRMPAQCEGAIMYQIMDEEF